MTLTFPQILMIAKYWQAGEKIQAMKATRGYASCGLLDAKTFCDSLGEFIMPAVPGTNYKQEMENYRERLADSNCQLDWSVDRIDTLDERVNNLLEENLTLKKHKNTLLEMLRVDLS